MLCQLVVELVPFVVTSIASLGKSKMGSTLGQNMAWKSSTKTRVRSKVPST